MEYIVLDFEWNNPEKRGRLVKNPVVLHGEIIQIGAVKLNERLEELDSFNIKIHPEFYTKMNKIVKDLTGITDEDLAGCISFKEAIEQFKTWCGDNCIFLTWGGSDIKILKENLLVHELDCNWIPESFDAQLMFDLQETMENRDYSLDYAVYYFGIKGNKGHDALNDAIDTASVIRHLELMEFIEEERAWRAEQDEEEWEAS